MADRVRSIDRYCLWNTLRSFHGDSWVAGTRAYKPEGDSQWIDDLGWGLLFFSQVREVKCPGFLR